MPTLETVADRPKMAGEQWIVNLQSEVDGINPATELERQRKQCIFKIPKILRGLNDNAYTPQLISFGPYHQGAAHLRAMERHKRLALCNYLRRAEKTLAEVADAMRPEVRELMDAYDGLEEPWMDEEKFLELMIVDSCFFLDLMIWRTVVFWRPYMTGRLWMDMLRLENQLPLAALAVLIEVGGKKEILHSMQYRRTASSRVTVKVDMEKIYDMLSWDFLESTLIKIGFHVTFVSWVMACIRDTNFTYRLA